MPTFSTTTMMRGFERAAAQYEAREPDEGCRCRVCSTTGLARIFLDADDVCEQYAELADEEAEADEALAVRIAADILAGVNLEVWCGKGAPPEGEAAIREYARWAAVNL